MVRGSETGPEGSSRIAAIRVYSPSRFRCPLNRRQECLETGTNHDRRHSPPRRLGCGSCPILVRQQCERLFFREHLLKSPSRNPLLRHKTFLPKKLLDPNVSDIEETVSTVATSLLDRARADDQDSWHLLVELHAPLVYGWCRHRGLNADQALDVGQEVFVAVARNLKRFERRQDWGTFRGWLRTIAENKIRDHWRRNEREPIVTGGVEYFGMTSDDDELASTRSDSKAIFVQLLEHAKDRVNPIHWDIFWEITVEEKSPADVAEKHAMERHNVYMIKSRVLRLLRDISREHREDHERKEQG